MSADEQTFETDELVLKLEKRMLEAAENLDFEQAAELRDRIDALREGQPVEASAGPSAPGAPGTRPQRKRKKGGR